MLSFCARSGCSQGARPSSTSFRRNTARLRQRTLSITFQDEIDVCGCDQVGIGNRQRIQQTERNVVTFSHRLPIAQHDFELYKRAEALDVIEMNASTAENEDRATFSHSRLHA